MSYIIHGLLCSADLSHLKPPGIDVCVVVCVFVYACLAISTGGLSDVADVEQLHHQHCFAAAGY